MVRLGLIGCGRIGRVHADSIDVHPRAELAYVYDPVEAAAREVGDRFGAAWGTDVDALIDDPTVDAVVVASPTPTHVDFLTRAVRAGKAVLCEKPIDLDLRRVDACRAEIGALADRVMVGFNRRFDPSFRDIRTRVAAGEIGTLEQLVITSRDPAPPDAAYIATSGGLLRDMTIHDLDMARFFLGDVVEVSATGANLISDEIAAVGDIDGAGGATERLPVDPTGQNGLGDPTDPDNDDAYRIEFETASRVIATGAAPVYGRADAVDQAAAIEAVRRAAATGATVTLPAPIHH